MIPGWRRTRGGPYCPPCSGSLTVRARPHLPSDRAAKTVHLASWGTKTAALHGPVLDTGSCLQPYTIFIPHLVKHRTFSRSTTRRAAHSYNGAAKSQTGHAARPNRSQSVAVWPASAPNHLVGTTLAVAHLHLRSARVPERRSRSIPGAKRRGRPTCPLAEHRVPVLVLRGSTCPPHGKRRPCRMLTAGLLPHRSQFTIHGSRLTVHGSRSTAHGSRLTILDSRISTLEYRFFPHFWTCNNVQ